ncbi:MAG: glycosyl hydrolase [Terriglobia bacterium]
MKQNRRIFLRNSALAGGAITLRNLAGNAQAPAGSVSTPPSAEDESAASALVRRQFQSPPKKYGPLVRWWWPGNDVTDVELRREIDVLDKAGIAGVEIQPFIKGFNPSDFPEAQRQRIESYATPSFFRHVGTAVEEARSRGMFIDYTFGSGWPFGGGMDITPELASIEMRSTHLSVEGPAKLHERLQIPSVTDGDPSHGADKLKGLPEGWPERMRKRTKVVAVVAVRGEDAQWNFNLPTGGGRILARTGELERATAVDLTSHLQPDGMLSWDVPPGTWQLFVFCSVPTVQKVNAGAGDGPQLVMDHLSSAAFAAHAKHVGGNAIPFIGEFFGNGLRAIFCDSLEVAANLFWSDDFLAEFHRRRGYDLLPYLPILKVQSNEEPYGKFVDRPIFEMTGIGAQVRHDYRQTVSDLMIERFYEQFNRWAHEHKLLSRTQAHGSHTHVLRVYGETDIPETEDLYDEGGYDFLKMAASGANVYGRSIVGSESFVWSNALYQTTPEKMKLAADELLTAGVNAILYHGFPYRWPVVPPPGWHPFSGRFSGCYSSQLNEMNPFWPYLAQLNAYIARVQYISQTGKSISAVALYMNDLAHGAEESPTAPKLNQAMMDAGYNYDHINANSLLHSTVRDRMLVTTGGAHYRALVLPSLDAIGAGLAEKLLNFANAGLPILFAGQLPTHNNGLLESARKTQRVQTAMRGIRDCSNAYLAPDNEGVISMLRKAVNPNIKFHSDPLSFIQKQIGNINTFFIRNESDAMQRLDAEFETQGKPELWDPWTGRIAGIANYRRKGNWVEVNLDLEPMSSALIVFNPSGTPPSETVGASEPKLKRMEPVGAGGWKLIATGLVPSGKTAVIKRDLPVLIDWSLDSELRGFTGRGTYTTSFTISKTAINGRLILDLGNVKDVAEVTVNGKPAATLLLRPYRTDITELVHPGANLLEITVTNALFNTMVLRDPRTFRPGPTTNPSGLMSAGLIGPVEIKIMAWREIEGTAQLFLNSR